MIEVLDTIEMGLRVGFFLASVVFPIGIVVILLNRIARKLDGD